MGILFDRKPNPTYKVFSRAEGSSSDHKLGQKSLETDTGVSDNTCGILFQSRNFGVLGDGSSVYGHLPHSRLL